jgi:hypothetical protein
MSAINRRAILAGAATLPAACPARNSRVCPGRHAAAGRCLELELGNSRRGSTLRLRLLLENLSPGPRWGSLYMPAPHSSVATS